MKRVSVVWLRQLACAALLLAVGRGAAVAADSQLARTPPMGWNDWYQYECKVSDSIIGPTPTPW